MPLDWAAFKAMVETFLTDKERSNTTAVRAISDFVRAKIARELLGDMNGYNSHWASYLEQRKDLLGYEVTLTASALRTQVRELLTEAGINDTTAIRGIASFAKANLAREYGDLAGGEAFGNEWKSIRNRLLGYTVTISGAALRTEVNKLLTDATASNVTAAKAVSDYVLAAMSYIDGNKIAYETYIAEFRQHRRRLIGFVITATDNDLKTEVIKLISDVKPGDVTYQRALADYVKAYASLDFDGDQNKFSANLGLYRNQRRKLLGYTTALSDAAVKTAVKQLITDVTANEETAYRAIADFVKSRIARQIDHDEQEFGSYDANWKSLRARLLGYTVTSNAATLRTEVNKLITVDANRQGITVYIDTLIAEAVTEIGALDTFIDKTILQGKADIQAFNDFFDEQILQAKTEISGLNTIIDTLIEQATNEIASMATFINANIDQAKIDLKSPSEQIENLIRQAVIDLQEFIEVYREGQETTYAVSDVTETGEACTGNLPELARLRDAYFVSTVAGEDSKRNPVAEYPWDNRYDLIAGSPRMPSRESQFFIAIDPGAKTFTLFPTLLADTKLSLFWDGIKLEFADADETPFDEGMAKCVSDFVLSELLRRHPYNNLKGAVIHSEAYRSKRLALYRTARDRQRFSKNQPSRFSGSTCAVTIGG